MISWCNFLMSFFHNSPQMEFTSNEFERQMNTFISFIRSDLIVDLEMCKGTESCSNPKSSSSDDDMLKNIDVFLNWFLCEQCTTCVVIDFVTEFANVTKRFKSSYPIAFCLNLKAHIPWFQCGTKCYRLVLINIIV